MSESRVKVEVDAGDVSYSDIGGSAWQKLSDQLKWGVGREVASILGPIIAEPDPLWYATVKIELKPRYPRSNP